MTFVPSDSDERVVNNTMRHQYRVLNDDEKASMCRSRIGARGLRDD